MYSALLRAAYYQGRRSSVARVSEGSHSCTCHPHVHPHGILSPGAVVVGEIELHRRKAVGAAGQHVARRFVVQREISHVESRRDRSDDRQLRALRRRRLLSTDVRPITDLCSETQRPQPRRRMLATVVCRSRLCSTSLADEWWPTGQRSAS